MAGRGRGRDLTLPAWMTSSNGTSGTDDKSFNDTIAINSENKPSFPVAQPLSTVPSGSNYTANATSISNVASLSVDNSYRPVPVSTVSNPPSFAAPVFTGFTFGKGSIPSVLPTIPVSTSSGDPNNEKANWSIHTAEDGRKYWYNRVTEQSTYDKPFCLKTPEERSIPPCKWKQYSASGKIYYSDGVESRWDEPPEYREWREKIEAIEAKANVKHHAPRDDSKRKFEPEKPTQVYLNEAEAKEAFFSLLDEKKISLTAKIKEIKDLCQDDLRWNALKTTGEKNQALAEYQTKRIKQEKELKQAKAKRARDNFLVMLAENTKIDVRTRWSDAVAILMDDNRFKNIEEPREREDLFNEFISELEKKEREDRHKQKDAAIKNLSVILEDLQSRNVINRSSTWADCKDQILEAIRNANIRSLDERDIKHSVQDLITKLEAKFKEDERRQREEKFAFIRNKQTTFQNFLERLGIEGIIKHNDRVRDILLLPAVIESKEYIDLSDVSKSDGETVVVDTIDKVLKKMYDEYSVDRKTIKNSLYDSRFEISHDTTFDEVKLALTKFSSRETTEHGNKSLSKSDQPRGKSNDLVVQLQEIFAKRPNQIEKVFNDLLSQAVADYEERKAKQKRREERFVTLLEEYFFRSDQIKISWDEAKRLLEGRSSYEALSKDDRKRIFNDYMSDLKKKMETKTRYVKAHMGSSDVEEGEEKQPDNEPTNQVSSLNSEATQKRSRSGSFSSDSDDSDSSADLSDGEEKEKSKKSKKDKHKKDKHKHKKHKKEKSERSHENGERKKRHRSRS